MVSTGDQVPAGSGLEEPELELEEPEELHALQALKEPEEQEELEKPKEPEEREELKEPEELKELEKPAPGCVAEPQAGPGPAPGCGAEPQTLDHPEVLLHWGWSWSPAVCRQALLSLFQSRSQIAAMTLSVLRHRAAGPFSSTQ